MKECPVCNGEKGFDNSTGCGDPECCGYPWIVCCECDGDGEVENDDAGV